MDCGEPSLTNGSVTAPTTTFGAIARFSCDTGYDMKGTSKVTCQSDGSWGLMPMCFSKLFFFIRH